MSAVSTEQQSVCPICAKGNAAAAVMHVTGLMHKQVSLHVVLVA